MKPASQGWVILTRKQVGDFNPQNDILADAPSVEAEWKRHTGS
jgi:hypothetical protein